MRFERGTFGASVAAVYKVGSAELWDAAKASQDFRKIVMRTWVFCMFLVYRLSVIVLTYAYKVIFENKWITF
jgi:hypothetical protein